MRRLHKLLFVPPGWVRKGANLDLDFAKSRFYGGTFDLLSISRSSSGFAQDSFGNLTSFSSNVLRRTDLGLLIEEARTNTCLRSAEFDNSYHTKGNGGTGSVPTVTANAGTAPDGTATADRIQFALNGGTSSADNSTIGGFAGADVAFADGTTRVKSVWLKSNTGSSYTLTLRYNSTSVYLNVTPTWTRFSVAGASASDQTSTLQLRGGQPTTNSDSADVLAWGMQVEEGSFATSNISTTSGAISRAADAVSLLDAARVLLKGATYSAILKTNNLDGAPASPAFLIDGATGGNDRLIYGAGDTTIASRSSDSTVLTATLGSSATLTGGTIKSGIAVDPSGRSLVANGGTVATDFKTFGTAITPTLGGPSNYINGYVSRLSLFRNRVPDATLQQMSAL